MNSKDAIFCGKCGERLRNSEDMPQPDEVEEPKETEKIQLKLLLKNNIANLKIALIEII